MNLQRSATQVSNAAPVWAPTPPSANHIPEAEPTPIDSGRTRKSRKRIGEELSLRSASVLALVTWLTLVVGATAMLER
jgi:hypothetical protein